MLPRLKQRGRGWLAQVGCTCPARTQCMYAHVSHVAELVSCPSTCLGLSSTVPGVESGKPTHFTVLTKGAGKALVDASFSSPVKDFDIIDNYDYSQTVKYTPAKQVD